MEARKTRFLETRNTHRLGEIVVPIDPSLFVMFVLVVVVLWASSIENDNRIELKLGNHVATVTRLYKNVVVIGDGYLLPLLVDSEM